MHALQCPKGALGCIPALHLLLHALNWVGRCMDTPATAATILRAVTINEVRSSCVGASVSGAVLLSFVGSLADGST